MSAPSAVCVRLCPSDSPDGRIVVRLIHAGTGELVRAEEGGPIHFDTVREAQAACERAGLAVLSAQESAPLTSPIHCAS